MARQPYRRKEKENIPDKSESCILAPCTESEYPVLLDFLDRCFRKDTRHWFAVYMSHVFRPEASFIRQNLLCKRDNRIVGAIGIYPFTLRIGSASFRVGGVGSVSVLPEARGSGIMSSMLQQIKRLMYDESYDLSWLAGDRFRYRNFGWDLGGRQAHFSITKRDLERYYPHPEGMEPIAIQPECSKQLLTIYQRFTSRVERDDSLFKVHLNRRHFGWLAGTTNSGGAYLVYEKRAPENIVEIQGTVSSVIALLFRHCEEMDIHRIQVLYPSSRDPIFALLYQCAGTFLLKHSYQIQVMNIDSTWDKIVPELIRRHFNSVHEPEKIFNSITGRNDRKLVLQRALGFFGESLALPSHLTSFERITPLGWWIPALDAV